MIEFQSEEFSPLGGITAEGSRRTLGQAALDPLTVLVRESAQNCWDARLTDTSLEVTFELRTLTPAEREAFLEIAHADRDDRTGIGDLTRTTEELRLLTISDRGSTGLGGSLRANWLQVDERNDFVHFLRNIGEPPDRSHGGGTYGFGKAALYRASAVSTILVHTRAESSSGAHESRFMGAALGHNYQVGAQRFTGRHWWGRIADDGVIDPLLDSTADEQARALGMPGFDAGQTGTSIAIVQPILHDRTPDEFMRFIRTALLWNFWPKMVPFPGRSSPPMRFRLALDGQELAAPNPRTFPPLDGFVEALRALRDPEFRPDGVQTQLYEIECLKPHQRLGALSLRNIVRQPRLGDDFDERDDPIPLDEPARHIALLRTPELVVGYFAPLPPVGNDMAELVGVFRADDSLDAVYAGSEPPTHNTWEADGLEDRHHRTFVKLTYQRIREAVRDFTNSSAPKQPGVTGRSLAGLAGRLAELLPGSEGTGGSRRTQTPGGIVVISDPEDDSPDADSGSGWQPPDRPPQPGSGDTTDRETAPQPPERRARRQRARVEIAGAPELLIDAGRRVLAVPFAVSHAEGTSGTFVEVEAGVVLEAGDREREAPAGSELPEVLAWVLANGERLPGGPGRHFDAGVSSALALVSVPADAEIDVQIRVGRERD